MNGFGNMNGIEFSLVYICRERHGVCTTMAQNDYLNFSMDRLDGVVKAGYLEHCGGRKVTVRLAKEAPYKVLDVQCAHNQPLTRNLIDPFPAPLEELGGDNDVHNDEL
jgi:hypothetical protein